MDIEAVAEETPDQIFKETIDPALGLRDFQARRIAFNFGLSGKGIQGDGQVRQVALCGICRQRCFHVRDQPCPEDL